MVHWYFNVSSDFRGNDLGVFQETSWILSRYFKRHMNLVTLFQEESWILSRCFKRHHYSCHVISRGIMNLVTLFQEHHESCHVISRGIMNLVTLFQEASWILSRYFKRIGKIVAYYCIAGARTIIKDFKKKCLRKKT